MAEPPIQLATQQLSLGYAGHTIVHDVDLVLPPGKVTMIIGANACGKSTLLRGLSRLLNPTQGSVLLDGTDIHRLPSKQLAQKLGLLPQSPTAPDGITVAELVSRGRYPHQGWFRRWSAEDDAAVVAALTATGTLALIDRDMDELSGGQRQRVWIAMALAQETPILLLDEPTTYLDLAHQVEVLEVMTELNRARGTTVVIVLHELNLATRYADHLIAMKQGKIVAQGEPRSIVTEALLQDVFGLDSVVIPDPITGSPLAIPRGKQHSTTKSPTSTGETHEQHPRN